MPYASTHLTQFLGLDRLEWGVTPLRRLAGLDAPLLIHRQGETGASVG